MKLGISIPGKSFSWLKICTRFAKWFLWTSCHSQNIQHIHIYMVVQLRNWKSIRIWTNFVEVCVLFLISSESQKNVSRNNGYSTSRPFRHGLFIVSATPDAARCCSFIIIIIIIVVFLFVRSFLCYTKNLCAIRIDTKFTNSH